MILHVCSSTVNNFASSPKLLTKYKTNMKKSADFSVLQLSQSKSK